MKKRIGFIVIMFLSLFLSSTGVKNNTSEWTNASNIFTSSVNDGISKSNHVKIYYNTDYTIPLITIENNGNFLSNDGIQINLSDLHKD